MRKSRITSFSLLLALSSAAVAAPQNNPFTMRPPLELPSAPSPYRHAYYLFLSDLPIACEQCYVPLLLTVVPLEEIAKDPAGQDGDLITTYERDSIYQFGRIVHVPPADIVAAPRTIRVHKRNYRYQEITAAEVLHLLEHPMGTIPVSRTNFVSELPAGPRIDDLITGFRAVK